MEPATKGRIRTLLVSATAVALLMGVAMPISASATVAGCFETVRHEAVDEVSHQEYRYEKEVPKTDDVLEYRYEKTFQEGTKLYEVKNILNWSYTPPWAYTPAVNGQVPFSLIQAAGFNPQSLGLQPNVVYNNLPGGTYGLPNDSDPTRSGNQSFSYIFTYTDTKPTGWPSSGWDSFTSYSDVTVYWPTDGTYTTDAPPTGYTVRDSQVKTQGTPASKIYYVDGAAPTSVKADASWVLTDPDGAGPWTEFENRKVIDTPAKDAYDEQVSVPCKVTLDIPTAKDLCGEADDHYGLPADKTGVAYTRDDRDIIATLTNDSYEFDTLPVSWVDNGDGTATYAFEKTVWSSEPCLTKVTPVAGAPVYGDCKVEGNLDGFVDTTQYTWVANGPITARTVTATAVGNVVLEGQTDFGPYDLSKKSGQVLCPSGGGGADTEWFEDILAPSPWSAMNIGLIVGGSLVVIAALIALIAPLRRRVFALVASLRRGNAEVG